MGAYKKLKSYFYYDKTILYNKMRLSLWESNEAEMNMRVEELATFLTTIESSCDYKYLRMLISGIKFIPMPKSFEDDPIVNNLLQNKAFYNNALRAVNFFIQAPVELMVLDTIWMLIIDKIAADQGMLVPEAYANKVKSQIIKDGKDFPVEPAKFEDVIIKDLSVKNNKDIKQKNKEFFEKFFFFLIHH